MFNCSGNHNEYPHTPFVVLINVSRILKQHTRRNGIGIEMFVKAQVSGSNAQKRIPSLPPLAPPYVPKVSPEGNIDVNILSRAVLAVSCARIYIDDVRRCCSHHDILDTQERNITNSKERTHRLAMMMKLKDHNVTPESRARSS